MKPLFQTYTARDHTVTDHPIFLRTITAIPSVPYQCPQSLPPLSTKRKNKKLSSSEVVNTADQRLSLPNNVGEKKEYDHKVI